MSSDHQCKHRTQPVQELKIKRIFSNQIIDGTVISEMKSVRVFKTKVLSQTGWRSPCLRSSDRHGTIFGNYLEKGKTITGQYSSSINNKVEHGSGGKQTEWP
ncbi:hypothetical protein ABEB36_013044 [Hypothenemus hampei]|uniref:Uncharacterized protein n=1 Tax=Hypothenemus hampei TaxID=57062 RepID=A0ABD1E7G7_HYPHA